MGKASRKKRELREMEMTDLPENLRFGPEFLEPREPEVIIGVQLATAHGGVKEEG
jgi:hypothetical protein